MNKGLNKTTEVEVVTGAFLFMSRQSYEVLDGFDERFFFYMDDTDLCYRHKKNNNKVIYFPETSIIHLKGKSAKGESWFKNKYQSISTIKFFQKHFAGVKFLLAIIFHFSGLLLRVPIFLLGGIILLKNDLIKRSFYYIRLLFTYNISLAVSACPAFTRMTPTDKKQMPWTSRRTNSTRCTDQTK